MKLIRNDKKSFFFQKIDLQSESGSLLDLLAAAAAFCSFSCLVNRMLRRRNDPELLLLAPRLKSLPWVILATLFFSSSA